MNRIGPNRLGGYTRLAILAEIEARFSRLPEFLRDWLAGQPGVLKILTQLQQHLDSGVLSGKDIVELVAKWSNSLPPRRGAIVDIRNFMQPELPLGLPEKPPRRRRRRKRRP